MALEHSPENAHRVQNPSTGTGVIPNVSVLRARRTRARRALETEVERLRNFEHINAENRLEVLTTRARIDGRLEEIRKVIDQLCSHPLLRDEEIEREAEDAEAAISDAISAKAMAEGLLALQSFESNRSNVSGNSSVERQSVDERQSSAGERDVSQESAAGGSQTSTATTISSAASEVARSKSTTSASVVSSNNCANSSLYLDTTPDVFDGNSSHYNLWRSQFMNHIRRRTLATDTDKLVALSKFLKGPPKDLICELPLIDNNFDVALKLLDDNYDIPEIHKRDVLANITNVPSVRHQNDIIGLRELLNVTQRAILSLEAVKVPLNSIALPYEQTIRKALPTNMLLNFEEYHQQSAAVSNNDDHSDPAADAAIRLEGLLNYLRRYTALRERVSAGVARQARNNVQESSRSAHGEQRRDRTRQNSKHPPLRSGISTVAAAAKSIPRKQAKSLKNSCLFCDSNDHRPSACSADITRSRRQEILEQRRRCLSCFRFEHKEPRLCGGPQEPCRLCGSKSHYTVMHDDNVPAPAERQQTAASLLQSVAAVSSVRAVVMTASALVVCGDRRIPVRCFFDGGSMVSFVTTGLIKRLPHIHPRARVELRLQGFASEHTVTANRYCLPLVSTYDDSEQIDIQAHEFDFGVDPPANCSEQMRGLIREFGQTHPLADVSLTFPQFKKEPDLLIGIDQMYKIMHLNGEMRIGGDLIGRSSRFGWIVSGSFGPMTTRGDVALVHPICCAATLSNPARDVQNLWTLDSIGIVDTKNEEYSAAESDALSQFRADVHYDGQQYCVSMPKKDSIHRLANNLEVARMRLLAKRRGLARDDQTFQRYDREIMEFLRAGHAEEITDVDVNGTSARDHSYYMPHRQVVTQRPNGDKWRIVFDCSSCARGETSLNSHLLTGPNLNPDILKLLMNFRLRPIALSADVTQAYLTLSLAAEDRSYFRYLWQGPGDKHIRCFQMKKVIWGAGPSGFLLAAVLREHFRKVDPRGTYDLSGAFYFDDMLCSFDSVAETIAFIDKLIRWMNSAGMRLSKWKANSNAVINHLNGLSSAPASSELVASGVLKVLGIAWNPSEDKFLFQLTHIVKSIAEMKDITKRSVLRAVASIYDPVGWLIPFTVRGKIIIQQLWSETLQWDDPVLGPTLQEFIGWSAEIAKLSDLRIPRLYGMTGKKIAGYQLHVFGDASERAYAAVAYLQTLYSDGDSACALVMSKSRIAPKQKITLPRLELMAAVLAARLRKFVIDRLGLSIDRVFHYTDSTVTFYWCTSAEPTKWKAFVCNRVLEVQQLTSTQEWLHVSGNQNISDIASRGVAVDDLISNDEWWHGPRWLSDPESRRPVRRLRSSGIETDSVGEELRGVVAPVIAAPPLFDLDRFSSWEKTVRVVTNVLRFIRRCRRHPPAMESVLRSQAEIFIIKSTQTLHFAAEISATLAKEPPARSSKLASYRLQLDDNGLLRVRTRLNSNPHMTFDERNPIIIPSPSRLATLLVLHFHRINAHLGVSTVLSAIRRRYWVLRGRQVIKSLLRGCVICRRLHAPTADQVQAPLPEFRTSLIAPFAVTAVDFCGPFHTSSREGARKNYIALFTCTCVRAVHLEVVEDMSTLHTHLALRRFLAQFPACRLFVSDNGKSFVRAAADIRRLFNSFRNPEVREMLAQRRIEWTFNCPRAPWRGGVFERLIGVTKSALKKTLGRSFITAEEFRTILCELSSIINDRPLSYSYSEPDEPQAITPSQLLRGGPSASPLCAQTPLDSLGPNGLVQAAPADIHQLREALLQRTNYFRALSTRWKREYLMLLRSANLDGSGKPRPVPEGSVCILKDDNNPRAKWVLVRVLKSHPGRDGVVRTYSVRFANGYESRRAAQLLIPLEVPEERRESNPQDDLVMRAET